MTDAYLLGLSTRFGPQRTAPFSRGTVVGRSLRNANQPTVVIRSFNLKLVPRSYGSVRFRPDQLRLASSCEG
jgi:hypothetical protein